LAFIIRYRTCLTINAKLLKIEKVPYTRRFLKMLGIAEYFSDGFPSARTEIFDFVDRVEVSKLAYDFSRSETGLSQKRLFI